MLEEILALILSFFPSLTLDSLHFSREVPRLNDSTIDERHQSHGEYETIGQENFSSNVEYVQGEHEIRVKPTHIQSLARSLKATFSMTSASLVLVLIGMFLVYFDLRTCDLCSEWLFRNNTLSFDVMRFRLIGDVAEVMVLNVWFPLTLIVLFGYGEFRQHYSTTILPGLIAGLLYSLYLSILLLYGVYDTKLWYRVPGNVSFAVGIIWACAIVVRKIRQNHPTVSYSYRHIFTVLCFPLLFSFLMAIFYRYAIVTWFNSTDNVLYRFVLTVMTPTLAIVPTAICRHMALWRSSEIIEPERSFVLVYFIRPALATLHRIMQANFNNTWLFVGISLLSGLSGLFRTATERIREKIWARVISFLRRTCCARRLQPLPVNTPNHRRLKADIDIQNILFENFSLLISQIYIVFYMVTSFVLSDWTAIVKECSIRIAIALGIEFIFNLLSIFVQIQWYDIPVGRVWSKFWKRHVFANGIIVAMLVFFFSISLVSVFQARLHNSLGAPKYTVRKCTLPYEDWR